MEYKRLWTPDPDLAKRSQIYQYMEFVNAYSGRKFKTYEELHRWISPAVTYWGLIARGNAHDAHHLSFANCFCG